MADSDHSVPTPRPPAWVESGRADRWLFVLESLCGGLDDDGMLKWLAVRTTFDAAVEDAEKLRGGMVAT